MTISTEMSENRQRKASKYAKTRRALFFANSGLGLTALLLALFSGFSLEIRKLLENWNNNQWLVVLLYMILMGGIYATLTFPLNVYSSLYLPRKYGLSHQTLGGWLIDVFKGAVIGGIIGLLLISLLYLGLRSLPEWWWLAGGIFYLFFVIVMSNLAPVIILPLFNKFIPLENDELRERMLRLADKTGARVKGIYTMDFSRRTSTSNAFVTGVGNTRRIVLGDTLTQHFTADEIEVVMAHELGHHVHGDIGRGIFFDATITLAGLFIANLLLQNTLGVFGFRDVGDVASFPLLALVLMGFGLITNPVTNAYSRNREKAADYYALDITENVASFITCMKKLANQNLAEVNPPGWAIWLFYTHPPISERVRLGENYARKQGLNPYPDAGYPQSESGSN
ncbi:M48 family metallopeptidase [Candidatus Chlorohelix sp.]|uniref:M48 family metallopeptidase n=1 Tax=Candidatus Chlorohelix sp. TaxID=3139201 RepID=UPI00303E2705